MTISASETRRSPPFLTADGAIDLGIEVEPPVHMRGRTIDAADLPRDEPLRAQLRIAIDWVEFRRDTKFTAPVDLKAVARCRSTRWSGADVIETEIEEAAAPAEYGHTLLLLPDEVAETVDAEIVVTPSSDDEGAPPEVARERHQVLARRSFKVRYERAGFEFPTKWMSFEGRYPPHALWRVHIAPDSWTAPIEEAVQVHLNEDADDFYQVLEDTRAAHRLPAAILRSHIAHDTLAQIFSEYFDTGGVEEAVDPEGERFCDVVHRTLEKLFDESPDAVRDGYENDPALFRTKLQDAMELDGAIEL